MHSFGITQKYAFSVLQVKVKNNFWLKSESFKNIYICIPGFSNSFLCILKT